MQEYIIGCIAGAVAILVLITFISAGQDIFASGTCKELLGAECEQIWVLK